jgi:hypothetical protein
MSNINEVDLINRIAYWESQIEGIQNSYSFAQNPDNLLTAQAPAVLHMPASFTSQPKAHHNRWQNIVTITSHLFVLPRETKGGTIRFLENDAMPYLQRWRNKFQSAEVIRDLLSLGPQSAWLTDGNYGVGGTLTINGKPWIGCTFTFRFSETI